ncbi:MAG: hypothetical protein L0Z53_20745 [Acidobacteriales bacterium]|nr:hypothetical protein [Terriglobales bacterium]
MGNVESNVVSGLLAKLTGQEPPLQPSANNADALLEGSGIGHSQFNEIMLLLGYDRITDAFFQYLVDGKSVYQPGGALRSAEQLKHAVDRFRILAMLRYGNIKYAFKNISTLGAAELTDLLRIFEPISDEEFATRHDPVQKLVRIPGDKTFYLGYLIKAELEERLRKNPQDATARAQLQERSSLVEAAIQNHQAYLASDHMDVYVATSMRERYEFFFVHAIVNRIFGDPQLAKLKLRWFDPTQAYCHDRIDKGLSEALMLKRAKCTIYFAQESDTLGKDSELASTLAQGKPVIAYIPELRSKNKQAFIQWVLDTAGKLYPDQDVGQLICQQLQVFAPHLAWSDKRIQGWIQNPSKIDQSAAQVLLAEIVQQHYDKRADTLKNRHPLGIQVHLETGVANGVIVARSIKQCVELIHRVMTKRLEFEVVETVVDGKTYLLLKESITGSTFRVVTGDRLLTNAFWNFYLF